MSWTKLVKILKIKHPSSNFPFQLPPYRIRTISSLHPLLHAESDKDNESPSKQHYGKVDNPQPLGPPPGDSPLQKFGGLNPGIKGPPGPSPNEDGTEPNEEATGDKPKEDLPSLQSQDQVSG